MTRTLTLNATVQLDGGTITLDLDGVDLDGGQPLVLDVLARVLGLDRIDHPATASPVQITDMAGTAERAPVVTTAPVTDEDRDYLRSPERLKNQAAAKKAPAKKPAVKGPVRREDTVPYEKRRPGKATGPKSGPHAPGQFAAPGTALHAILTVLADHGGRWEGTAVTLGTEAGAATGSAAKSIRALAAAGLVTTEKAHPRQITAIALTGDGWAHLGRGKPTDIHSLVLTPPAPEPDDHRPPVIDIATLPREGRKPFDPDAARNAAASAL